MPLTVENHVRKCVLKVVGDYCDVDSETRMVQDLGMDSLDFMDLCFQLETEFGVDLEMASAIKDDGHGDISLRAIVDHVKTMVPHW